MFECKYEFDYTCKLFSAKYHKLEALSMKILLLVVSRVLRESDISEENLKNSKWNKNNRFELNLESMP